MLAPELSDQDLANAAAERLALRSVQLNRFMYRLAIALGHTDEGQGITVNPEDIIAEAEARLAG